MVGRRAHPTYSGSRICSRGLQPASAQVENLCHQKLWAVSLHRPRQELEVKGIPKQELGNEFKNIELIKEIRCFGRSAPSE